MNTRIADRVYCVWARQVKEPETVRQVFLFGAIGGIDKNRHNTRLLLTVPNSGAQAAIRGQQSSVCRYVYLNSIAWFNV